MLFTVLNSLATFGEKIHTTFKPAQQEAPTKSHLGKVSKVYGPNLEAFTVQYAVVELDSLISSDLPNFPQQLQPRDRSRIASSLQINSIANKLNPIGLLEEFKSLDRGAPIISENLEVLSGNGRVMALRQSPKYGFYKSHLGLVASKFGITREINWLKKPVLVRVLRSNVDLVEFCKLANGSTIMSQAITESSITESDLIKVNTGDLDEAMVIGNFLNNLPTNERAALVDSKGELNKAGRTRFQAALFFQVYGKKDLVNLAFEEIDPDIKNIIGGMLNSLLPFAQVEQMVTNGERDHNCALGKDLGAAVSKFVTLRQDKIKVSDYLSQIALFEDELTDTQKLILGELPGVRSKKQMTELLDRWIEIVRNQPDPRQSAMFGYMPANKSALVNSWLS